MKFFYTRISTIVLVLLCLKASAQFKGGAGDGVAMALVNNAQLGRNIFVGGADDGTALSLAASQPLGRNIYIGGPDDGFTSSLAANQSLGRNIYLGGADDGHAIGLAVNQSLGRNIFLGGADDGFSSAVGANQQLGRNIFLGGANDGWAMAMGTAQASALPITLSEFSGTWQQNNALLKWRTASEFNSSHFELEISFDGNNFSKFGSVKAAGQSAAERFYQYTDTGRKILLPPGVTTVYYRLRSVDVDGTASYSGIVILRAEKNQEIQFSLYPNPAKDLVTINAVNWMPAATSIILISDAQGRLLMREQMTAPQQKINVSHLPGGTYFLQIVDMNKPVYTQKIIINK